MPKDTARGKVYEENLILLRIEMRKDLNSLRNCSII
jgi:hypothetical protein